MDKKLFRSILILLLIASILALAVIKIDAILSFSSLLISVLTPVFAGVLISMFIDRPYALFRRLYLWMFRKAKRKHKAATALAVATTYLVLIAFIAVFLIAVIPEVTSSISILMENIRTYIQNVEDAINNAIEKYNLQNILQNADFSEWEQWLTAIMSKALDFVQTSLPQIFNITRSIAGGLTNAVLSIIISIYIMLNKSKLKWQAKKLIYAFLPQKAADGVSRVASMTTNTVSGYIAGRVVDSIIVGILCFIFMKLFGFQYASLISFIIGVTNIIPMLGPFIGAIPSAFLLLLVNPVHCFWFIVFIIVLQQVDSNVIDPRISGEATGLPPLWVLISITVGGGLFGLLGFILSVPIGAVLYTLIQEAVQKRSAQKGIPLDDEPDRDPPSKFPSLKPLFRPKTSKTKPQTKEEP